MPRPESDRVRVFISYAHASPQHKADVETLAVLLDAGGVEVILDIWQDALRRHWPTWARESIDTCDFVLAVASSVYKGAAEGKLGDDEYRGTQSETLLLQERLQEERSRWRLKILPVVLPGRRVVEIPTFLNPQTETHYKIERLDRDGIQELLATIGFRVREGQRDPQWKQHLPSWQRHTAITTRRAVVGFGPGNTVAVVDGQGGVHRWAPDGTELSQTGGTRALQVGKQALISSTTPTVAIARTGELELLHLSSTSNEARRELVPLDPHELLVTSGGQVFATHDNRQLTVRSFDDGLPIRTVPCPPKRQACAINADGSIVATATSHEITVLQHGTTIHRLRFRNSLPHLRYRCLQHLPLGLGCWLAVSPSGNHIACVSFEELVVSRTSDGTEVARRPLGDRESLESIGIEQAQMRLLCTDTGVPIWLKQGRLSWPATGPNGLQMQPAGFYNDVAASNDGTHLAYLHEDGTLLLTATGPSTSAT